MGTFDEWVFDWDEWGRWDDGSVGGYDDLPPELRGSRTPQGRAEFVTILGQRVRTPAEWDEGVED